MVHKLRNLLAHIPSGQKTLVAALVRTIFVQPNRTAAGTQVTETLRLMRERWPQAAEVLAAAEEDVLAYMSFPVEHWSRIYSTNPLERLNREIRRRTDVVGVFLHGVDTEGYHRYANRHDLVVLAIGMQPSVPAGKIPAEVIADSSGFIEAAAPGSGIFGAGCATNALDVNRAVQSATAATLRAIQVVNKAARAEA